MRKLLFIVIILAFLWFFLKSNCNFTAKHSETAVLPPGIKSKLIVKNGKTEYIKATAKITREGNSAKAKQPKEEYLSEKEAEKTVFSFPPEGGFEISEDMNGEQEIKLDNYGFTFNPYLGAGFCGKDISPAAGLRLFYYENWGAGGLYLHNAGFMFSIERRLIETPFSNTIIFAGFNGKTAALGAAVFL